MRIINPIIYRYFDKSYSQKKTTNKIINEFIYLLYCRNIYFIDIDNDLSKIKFKKIKNFIDMMENNKNNVEKFCNEKEKEKFHKSLSMIKEKIKYIENAIEDNYDTILAKAKNVSVKETITFDFTLHIFNGDFKLNQDLLDFTFIDKLNIKNMTKEKLESFFKLYLSKLTFNNKYVSDNLGSNLLKMNNMYDIKQFNRLNFSVRSDSENDKFDKFLRKMRNDE